MPTVPHRLVNSVNASIISVGLRYAVRAAIAALFVLAVCFAIAAIAATLVDRLGSVSAYWIMTAGLVVIGSVLAVALTLKERTDEAKQKEAARQEARAIAAEGALQAPMGLASSLLSAQSGAATAFGLLRLLGRNLPLAVFLAAVAGLFWPTSAEGSHRRAERERWRQRSQERYLY